MLYSLQDFEVLFSQLEPKAIISFIGQYATRDLLDPVSKKLFYRPKFLSIYSHSEAELTKNLSSLKGKISRTEAVLYHYAQAENEWFAFGQLLSCSSFQAFLENGLLTVEQESKLSQGLLSPRTETVLKQDLPTLLNHAEDFRPWLENPYVLKFVRRQNFLPIPESEDSLTLLNEDYQASMQVSFGEAFNLALAEDRLVLLDEQELPPLEEIAFYQCKNLSSLAYILGRLGDVSEDFLPSLYSRVLQVPGKSRLDLLNSFFLKQLQEEKNEYPDLWAASALQVATTADLETVREYFLLMGSIINNISLTDIFLVFIQRGSYFYLESIKILNQLGGEKGRVIDNDVFLINLPYLRDATLLANILRKPENSSLLDEAILHQMAQLCVSLKYEENVICGSRNRAVIGIAMLDIILEEMQKRRILPDWKAYLKKAFLEGSAITVKYLLRLSQLESIEYIPGLEDIIAPLVKRQISVQKAPYYELDAEKALLAKHHVQDFDGQKLIYRAVANVNDNVEAIAILKELLGDKKLIEIARAAHNYRILFYLLSM